MSFWRGVVLEKTSSSVTIMPLKLLKFHHGVHKCPQVKISPHTIPLHDHLRCPGMELYILNQLSTPTSLPIQMSPSYRKLSPKHPYTTPTRSFASTPNPPLYTPTLRKIFMRCSTHTNPLIQNIGNYTIKDRRKTLNIYTKTLNTFSYKCYQP